jgi:hypothetical protein
MVSVARKLSTIEEQCKEQCSLFRRGDYRNKGHKPEKLSSALVLVKPFSLPWKLLMAEEHRDQHGLFRRGDCRNKWRNPENTVLGSSSGEDGFSVRLKVIAVDN